VRSLAAAGTAFLLCVLWFDLMFDVQARGHPGDVPADVRASIAAYYARVTTAARPMNRLVALAMAVTIGATVGELLRGELPAWRAVPALLLTLAAVGLAAGRTVANARRLGRQSDDAEEQSRLARLILHDHVACISAIAAVLVLQLAPV
jgi:ribose/xylose/arabinose/galactoside ABC-type transport system permease subunit